MKRFLILGAIALASITANVDKASAWINSNFGVGMNWSWQCGGNDFMHGLFRCGQPCGPDFNCQQVPAYPRQGAPMPAAPCPPGGAPGFGYGPGPVAAPVQAFRYPHASYYGYGR